MNLPNIISIARIFLVPVILFSILHENYSIALVLFFVAGLSDALDGFIARRFNLCTRLGAMLDPVADKFLVISTVLVLFRQGLLPIWLMLAIVSRDLFIISGAAAWYCRFKRIEIAPSFVGKLNTFLQVAMLFLVLAQASGLKQAAILLPVLFLLVFLATLVSGLNYIVIWGIKACKRKKDADC
jgi:cardiolipin synthase (CMP-forming)